jgi:hypothetical protein
VVRLGHESHERKTRNVHIFLVGKPEEASLRKTRPRQGDLIENIPLCLYKDQ